MADERIRVAHVITRMIVGGAQETVLLAAALADRSRFEPFVVCGPQTGSEGSLHDEARRRGVELVVLPDLVREVNPLRDFRAERSLERVFRDRRVDVVHTNSSKAGIVGRLAARRAGVRGVVHTVHGWPFHEHQSPVVAATWRRLERWAAARSDRLIVVADADRGTGLAAGVGTMPQYATVRSALELTLYDPLQPQRAEVRLELGIPAHAPVVGAVNRLSDQKDPLTLVDGFAVVRATLADAHLLLVGDGPLAGAVRHRVSALGLEDAVTMPGLRDDVPRLLQGMDVFVSTSLWEGLPRTIIAAMASGVPVVATPVGGVCDVVRDGETGLLAPQQEPDAIAAAVVRVLTRPDEGRRIAAAGLVCARAFDAQQMVGALEEVYAALAGTPARQP